MLLAKARLGRVAATPLCQSALGKGVHEALSTWLDEFQIPPLWSTQSLTKLGLCRSSGSPGGVGCQRLCTTAERSARRCFPSLPVSFSIGTAVRWLRSASREFRAHVGWEISFPVKPGRELTYDSLPDSSSTRTAAGLAHMRTSNSLDGRGWGQLRPMMSKLTSIVARARCHLGPRMWNSDIGSSCSQLSARHAS